MTSQPAPLFVIINEGAGADTKAMPANLNKMFSEAGHAVTILELTKGSHFKNSCKEIAEKAAAAGGVLVAAGGDGTVNGVAQLCFEYDLPLAVIPLGTFNYFARALDIPLQLEKAVALIGNADIRNVSAGFVQEHLFLNNASFGLYPKLIKKREAATARFGRKRIIGAVSALHSLFQAQKCYSITFKVGEEVQSHRTTMVFVGNNTFQLETLGLDVSECTKREQLAVVIMKSLTRLKMARLIWRGIVKNLKFEDHLKQFCASDFVVETATKQLDMVIDGEIIRCASPLHFRVDAKAIKVLVPKPEPQ